MATRGGCDLMAAVRAMQWLVLQDAQLSQRDRAAGCVIVFAESRTLELRDNDLRTYRSIFNNCHIIGLKICRIP